TLVGNGTHTGTFTSASGATVQMTASNHTFNGVTFGGTGSTRLNGGSGTLSGTVTANNFEFAGGTLGGTAQVNGTGFNWTGGTFAGGTLTMNAGSVLTIGGAAGKTLSGYTLANAGTVNWTSSNNLLFENGAVISNNGLFDVKTDADLQHTTGATPAFINVGTLRKSAGAGDTVIGLSNVFPFTNTGTVDAQIGSISIAG